MNSVLIDLVMNAVGTSADRELEVLRAIVAGELGKRRNREAQIRYRAKKAIENPKKPKVILSPEERALRNRELGRERQRRYREKQPR